MLRGIPAVRAVLARLTALLRSGGASAELPVSEFVDQVPGETQQALDPSAAALKLSGEIVDVEPESDNQSERENLIRRSSAWPRSDSGEGPVSNVPAPVPGMMQETVDQPLTGLVVPRDIAGAGPATEVERERCSMRAPRDSASAELPVSRFVDDAPEVTTKAGDQPVIALQVEEIVVVVPEPDDQSGREKLIRWRWIETGIKMWNPDINGAGRAALNIQGRAGVLPARPGERLPGYDKLEFRLIDGLIVCEGVAVDPPARRK